MDNRLSGGQGPLSVKLGAIQVNSGQMWVGFPTVGGRGQTG